MSLTQIIVTADDILDPPQKADPAPMPETIVCDFPPALDGVVKIKHEGTTYINRRFVT